MSLQFIHSVGISRYCFACYLVSLEGLFCRTVLWRERPSHVIPNKWQNTYT